ncbi:hypothetical protein [uncultured Roseovarius sp.]|uniref:hypothetical protein n=1 Tax=uncultured Roseovarius sp. TaxID=293344 RepID=UPI002638AD4B|nr:hypothetical protein [uncultured Roseovarius sp.]
MTDDIVLSLKWLLDHEDQIKIVAAVVLATVAIGFALLSHFTEPQRRRKGAEK